jgi:hypothetical protein
MKTSSLSTFCLPLALALVPATLQAQGAIQNADVQALRTQIEALRTEYQGRIQALEKQLESIQAQMLRLPEPEAAPAAAVPATAQVSPGALNPAISVVGNFLGRADNQKVFLEDGTTRIDNQFNLRETEVDLRVPVDPFSDAVLITSFESERPGQIEATVEEGYVNIRKLPFLESPLGLKFQIGRFRPAFGKFNTLHTHDLPQSTRSLLTEEFLGEEGFISQGISTDFFVPTPWDENSSLNARLQVLTGGDVALSPDSNHRLAYLGNLRWFKTIAGTHNTEIGWSSYWHPGTATTPIARMHAIDFMYKWKPFRQGEWKSYLLGGEAMFSDPVESPSASGVVRRPKGVSVFTQWQFDRRKYAGARFDYTTTLADPTLQRKSITPYFSYYFSEFLRLRFNVERRWSEIPTEDRRNTFFAELNWIFGAHPPEPFWVNK